MYSNCGTIDEVTGFENDMSEPTGNFQSDYIFLFCEGFNHWINEFTNRLKREA